MKKILSILSALIIILMLFSSCNSVGEPPVLPSETSTPSETVKPTEKPTETEPLYHTDSENNLLIGDISIDNYIDYQKFINEVNLPDHFIKYEDIASLGKFKHFYINSLGFYSLTGELLSYNYEIELEDGFSFRLNLSLDLEDVIRLTPTEEFVKSEFDFSNMRNLKKNSYKDYPTIDIIYESSGVTYAYFRETGELSRISFCKGGYYFGIGLCEGYRLNNYPDAPDTPVGKLLNIEDNDPAEVVASITKNINVE